MAKVVFGMAVSLDGYVNDHSGSVSRLYVDLAGMRETQVLQESIQNTGAVVMGRHTYDMANGDFTGYEYQVPIFVITHQVPAVVAKGENGKFKFNFVTDGVASAIMKAQAAAGDRDVTMVGGPDAFRQSIKAGLLDELAITIVPVVLGGGLRLFDHFEPEDMKLERIKVVASPAGRTNIFFRVVK
ncbi:MAG TPA: dihydrofolate reductase family protein [Phototrophicaceae bacterium]|nr:dihydrofolate reductase family protein [Phototrophicaceae bacterium]